MNAEAHSLPPHPFLVWYEKNVRWIIPVLILTLFSALSFFGFALASVIYKAMKSTDAYQAAWELAFKDIELAQRLGTPLEQGWSVSGKIQLEGESGKADFSFPVTGPKGKAIISIKGAKGKGVWDFYLVEFSDASGWRKILVDHPPKP